MKSYDYYNIEHKNTVFDILENILNDMDQYDAYQLIILLEQLLLEKNITIEDVPYAHLQITIDEWRRII